MDDINILVTGVGAPGIKGTIHSLENNFDNRKIRIIGTDIKNDVVGKYLCDKFYQISKPSTKYITQLLSICKKENVDVLLPQNTLELTTLSKHKEKFETYETKVAVSDACDIEIANDKYELMRIADKIGIPTAKHYLVNNFDDLINYAKELGWPKKSVVVKPPLSNGMRGLRIIDESINLKKMFYDEKPSSVNTKMDHLKNILGTSFSKLLIMEYLPNEEYTVDILNAGVRVIIPRKRKLIRSGITFNGMVEKNDDIIEYSERLGKTLKLKYAYGFQFKLDENNVPKLLESNPRIQGTMVLSTFAGANIIYGTVKHALGEKIPKFNIKWGTRMIRYWGGIGIYDNKTFDSL
jgi:carbamoyl-phosphate synthase large subunit